MEYTGYYRIDVKWTLVFILGLLMAGYVLYQTSVIATQFPPTHHVAAALMLFSTIATMFWYVLRFLMEMNRR